MHPITKTIEKFVPDAKLLEQRGESEIVYILPTRYLRSETNISIDFLINHLIKHIVLERFYHFFLSDKQGHGKF